MRRFKPSLQPVQSGQDLQALCAEAELTEAAEFDEFGSLLTRDNVRSLSSLPDAVFVRQRLNSSSSVGSSNWSSASRLQGLAAAMASSTRLGLNAGCFSNLAPESVASSTLQYAEPAQTVIFLDWDDTIFPTSELFDRWGLDVFSDHLDRTMTDAQKQALDNWRQASAQYLHMACALSERCIIVTNSKRPWVSDCVERFFPELKALFIPERLEVVYADEALKVEDQATVTPQASSSSSCFAGLGHWCRSLCDNEDEEEEHQTPAQLTEQKHAAMKQACEAFYSRYAGQTWKNILSFGDMRYERTAVQEVAEVRKSIGPARERLRTKAILVPGRPSIRSLTLMLDVTRILMLCYVRYDGDIDLNLRDAASPLLAISQALRMPDLGAVLDIPHDIWASADLEDEHVAQAIQQVITAVMDALGIAGSPGTSVDGSPGVSPQMRHTGQRFGSDSCESTESTQSTDLTGSDSLVAPATDPSTGCLPVQ